MIRVSALRYFLAVSPMAMWMRVGLAACLGVGAVSLWLNPADPDSALGSVVLLQMYAVSGGYVSAAGRGYYDAVLVTGRPMWRVACAHLAAAALPGTMVWSLLVALGAVLGHGGAGLSLHRQVAWLIVSVLGWSGGLAMPRMAGGAIWSIVLITLALSRERLPDMLVWLQSPLPDAGHTVMVAAVSLVCPFILLGDFPALSNAFVLTLDLVAVAAVAAGGLWFVSRRNHPLVEPL